VCYVCVSVCSEWEGACHYGVCQVCEDGGSGVGGCGVNPRVCIGGNVRSFPPLCLSLFCAASMFSSLTAAL